MAEFKMENEEVVVCIDEHASEIHSFKSKKTGWEYMWDGNPKYWKGRNPTLFPMVGSTWDKTLHINGKEYHTGNHGFTRNSDFTCTKHTDSCIVMEFEDTPITLEQYPFHFHMSITYTLDKNSLHIAYAIENRNEVVMPFNFGLHPAFRCPSDPERKFEEYTLQFEKPETFQWNTTSMNGETELKLDREALKDTIILHHPHSREVSLTDGTHGVTVHFEGYEWLAFWSPEAPFVCIEPWYSHTDFEKVEVPFEKREGTQFLNPNEIFHAKYSISVH